MRLGVLDIGSNTGHLQIVDAPDGRRLVPVHRFKEPLRLSEHVDDDGAVSAEGVSRLIEFVVQARTEADEHDCTTVLAFATSAVRDAVNAEAVLTAVREASGVRLELLRGEVEARLTFLAARRWFGWSAGHLAVFDIGGGSLEIAVGSDEKPELAESLPLGAARLTRDWMTAGRPVEDLRQHARSTIAAGAGDVLGGEAFDRAVGTSRTLRVLARACGAAAKRKGPFVRRELRRTDLVALVRRLAGLDVAEIAEIKGVPADRAHQIPAGAIVAEAVMDLFDVDVLEICPWALREGVLLQHLDRLEEQDES